MGRIGDINQVDVGNRARKKEALKLAIFLLILLQTIKVYAEP